MTGPIEPNTGGFFRQVLKVLEQTTVKLLEMELKLLETAGKVAESTGGSASQVRKASVPKVAATALSIPDPQKVAAAVKQSLIKEMGLDTLLEMAPPVRNIVLTGLTDSELDDFEIALSKGTTLQDKHKEAFQKVKEQIAQIRQERNEPLFKEILADHPEWKSQVELWKGVSLENKIWLLKLYELRNLGVEIPQIDAAPSAASLSLLKSSTKKAIIEELSKVTGLNCYKKELQKCPKAIGLLVNLQILNLGFNKLTAPPDVSRNVKLKVLELNFNQLTAPPDISQNVKLGRLNLNFNKLTAEAIETLAKLEKERKNLLVQY